MEYTKVQHLSLFFIYIYINDIPQRLILNVDADQSSIIIYHPEGKYFQNSVNDVIYDKNKWFKTSKLM
jgi:hypothetical protein